jgi:hypothetical protein
VRLNTAVYLQPLIRRDNEYPSKKDTSGDREGGGEVPSNAAFTRKIIPSVKNEGFSRLRRIKTKLGITKPMRVTTPTQRKKALKHPSMTMSQDFHTESRIECRTALWELSGLSQIAHNVQKIPMPTDHESRISRGDGQNKLEISLDNECSSKIRP